MRRNVHTTQRGPLWGQAPSSLPSPDGAGARTLCARMVGIAA